MLALCAASLSTPASAGTTPAPVSHPRARPAVTAGPALADHELLALKWRLADDRADRGTRPEPAASVSPPTAPPAPPRARGESTQPQPRRTQAPAARPSRRAPAAPAAPADGTRAAIVVAFALAQLGKPYVWAAAGPGSYDCSGLVLAAYARVGIALPHQTGGIVGYGRPVSRAALQPGDVVFPSGGHVAIYIGGGRMVHAPHPGARVEITDVYAFWTARRLL